MPNKHKIVDPLWVRPEGGWPEVFNGPVHELTPEDIEKLEAYFQSPKYKKELERLCAPYHNPLTAEALDVIIG